MAADDKGRPPTLLKRGVRGLHFIRANGSSSIVKTTAILTCQDCGCLQSKHHRGGYELRIIIIILSMSSFLERREIFCSPESTARNSQIKSMHLQVISQLDREMLWTFQTHKKTRRKSTTFYWQQWHNKRGATLYTLFLHTFLGIRLCINNNNSIICKPD